MAAHGLTILRQIRNVCQTLAPSRVSSYLDSALNAPGTCCTVGFDVPTYWALSSAQVKLSEGNMSPAELLPILEGAIQKHLWMDAYPCMDAIKMAQALYVKPHTPHFRKRQDAFDAGSEQVHVWCRQKLSQNPTYGDRRAPQISG